METKSKHTIKKVIETDEYVVFDDFLPSEILEEIDQHTQLCEYRHINTGEVPNKVWRIRDGFPLRSRLTTYHYANEADAPDEYWAFPTKTPFDIFSYYLRNTNHLYAPITGEAGSDWHYFTTTSWIYQAGTGLSAHHDGHSYTGAFAFFLNETWNIHWGGLLLVMPKETNQLIERNRSAGFAYKTEQWMDERKEIEAMYESGLAQCIFPKRNRIVFLRNDVYHLVTTVNDAAGDRPRRTIAGFFNKENAER